MLFWFIKCLDLFIMKKTKKLFLGKKAANRKSSIIFIQLGLVFALLLTYVALESKTFIDGETTELIPSDFIEEDDLFIPDTTPEPPKPKKVEERQQQTQDLSDLDIKDDNEDLDETALFPTDDDPDDPVITIDFDDIPDIPIEKKIIDDVPIAMVSEMPIFPGCEGDKQDLKKCLSKKITRIVKRNFNSELAQDLGLTPGIKRIFVLFVIDKDGNITKIKTNAPHKSLQREARRVIGKIPKMIPGKYNGKEVGVKYTLPISYQVME